jgi:hypothetical protein
MEFNYSTNLTGFEAICAHEIGAENARLGISGAAANPVAGF